MAITRQNRFIVATTGSRLQRHCSFGGDVRLYSDNSHLIESLDGSRINCARHVPPRSSVSFIFLAACP